MVGGSCPRTKGTKHEYLLNSLYAKLLWFNLLNEHQAWCWDLGSPITAPLSIWGNWGPECFNDLGKVTEPEFDPRHLAHWAHTWPLWRRCSASLRWKGEAAQWRTDRFCWDAGQPLERGMQEEPLGGTVMNPGENAQCCSRSWAPWWGTCHW